MSSTEIEDVLSSIRRLVSEEIRPLTRSRPAAVAPEPGKLILTPALRIVPQAAAPAPEPAVAAQPKPVEPAMPVFVATRRVHLVDDTEAPFAEVTPPAIDQVVASLGAAVTARSEDWEPEDGDPVVAGAYQGDPWIVSEPEFVPPAQAAAVANSDVPPPHESHLTIVEDVPAWAQDDIDMAEDPALIPDETAIDGVIEPDQAWADAAEASVIASLQAEAEGHQARLADAQDEAEDDAVRFNEDVLRELVRDILREELAGHMGERITRNIRKLVRSEIATILATQELE